MAGKDVRVGIGSNGMPVETDAAGRARIVLRAALTPGPYQVTTSFEGDAQHAPAGASAPIQITRRPTTLVIGGELAAAPNTVHATLEAVPSQPLHQRSVFLVFTGTGPTNVGHTDVFAGKTDPTGSVDVTDEFLAQLPVGSYRIDAYFNGVNLPGVLVLPPDSPEYEPATATATMNLRALFTGFFSPVANPPTFNTVQAGRTIPVKFSLGGDRGLAIFQAGYPKVTTVPCQTQASTHAIKQAASTASSGLTFDATTGLYTYLWKTQKGWTGCRQLTLRFADGTERYALFRFTK